MRAGNTLRFVAYTRSVVLDSAAAHVGGLLALGPSDHVELNRLAFAQRAKSLGHDRGVMYEDILAARA